MNIPATVKIPPFIQANPVFMLAAMFAHDEKKVLVSSTRYSRTTYTKVMEFNEGIDYFIENHYYEDLSQHERDD